jgi:methylaspartate mutase sigma subunit
MFQHLREQPTVIIGVAASDAHAVANQLIAHELRTSGYQVVNLGTCTPVAEFAAAVQEHPDAVAVVIGSLNGHIHEDLQGLRAAKASGAIRCPVIVGGNLSVGRHKGERDVERLYRLGADHVLTDAAELYQLLDRIAARAAARRSAS